MDHPRHVLTRIKLELEGRPIDRRDLIAQQIDRLGTFGIETVLGERQRYATTADADRVQVHDGDDDVGAIGGVPRIGQHVIVVGGQEPEPLV